MWTLISFWKVFIKLSSHRRHSHYRCFSRSPGPGLLGSVDSGTHEDHSEAESDRDSSSCLCSGAGGGKVRGTFSGAWAPAPTALGDSPLWSRQWSASASAVGTWRPVPGPRGTSCFPQAKGAFVSHSFQSTHVEHRTSVLPKDDEVGSPHTQKLPTVCKDWNASSLVGCSTTSHM